MKGKTGLLPGTKHDHDKPRPELLVPEFILAVSRAMAFGAKKYDVDNWQKVTNAKRRYIGAAFRHLLAFMKGDKDDPETGESHLAHCACCLMFLFWFEDNNKNERAENT